MASPEKLSRLTARYREEDSPALVLLAGLTRNLDGNGIQVLEDDLAAWGKPWVAHDFDDSIVSNVPDCPGIYMFIWRVGPRLRMAAGGDSNPWVNRVVLYVGQAGGSPGSKNTLRNRCRDYRRHLEGDPEDLWVKEEPKGRDERLRHYFQLAPLEYWFTVIEDRSRIEGAEKRLIRFYNPPINDINTPRLRATLGKTRGAW